MPGKLFKEVIKAVSAFGTLPFYLFLSIFVLLLGETKLFIWLFVGLIFSYIIMVPIRLLYYKERPRKESYKNILEKIDASSFPSSHSLKITLIFCLASFYYASIYVAGLFFLLYFFVLFSRYYLKKHYLIDIAIGSLIGFLGSLLIILFLNSVL